MTGKSEARWTIEELGDRVAAALADGYDGPADGRARAVPDQRTIRYYGTLGIVDRPAAMRGRTALYGERHLRQIVAVKRLQARGRSLAEIQRELAGITDRALAKLAAVPDEALGADAAAADAAVAADATAPAPPRRRDFWRTRSMPAVQIGVSLAPGLTLLFPATRTPDEEEFAALRRAAAPLIRELADRGLGRFEEEDERP